MGKPLHALIVEDSESDALLILYELRSGGYEPEFERVETAEAMRDALNRRDWDVVLSDYALPQFNAVAALAVLKDSGLDLPFIIISGAIGEDTAVAALKAGAHDFIMKGSTARLVPAVARELRDAENRREREQAEKTLRESEERLRRLTHQLITAQEEERRRLSRELHDETGQSLTALKLSLEMLRADLPADNASLHDQLGEVIALADSTMQQIRLLARNLRPPALDALGLSAALEGYCAEFSRRTQITAAYSAAPLPPLSSNVEIYLYRFLQEALTNVARHAAVAHARVDLRVEDGVLCLAVEDDGSGFDVMATMERLDPSAGIGLLGIQERLELIGGWLDIESRPGAGSRIIACVPLEKPA